MDTKDVIDLEPSKPKKNSYTLCHRAYYYRVRKYKDAIKRWLNKYPIPLSVYEDYIDEEMNFKDIDLENAYLAIFNYVNLLKIERLLDNHSFEKIK
jgi:hypothetical protein